MHLSLANQTNGYNDPTRGLTLKLRNYVPYKQHRFSIIPRHFSRLISADSDKAETVVKSEANKSFHTHKVFVIIVNSTCQLYT